MHYWIENHLNLVRFAPAIFFCAVVIFMFLGWLYGRYRISKSDTIVLRDALATSIFGLSALVLGFTFSSATSHFDQRIELIRQQGNAIVQVHQATKYLQASDRQVINKQLQQILQVRLSIYDGIENFDELNRRLAHLNDQLIVLNEQVIAAIDRAPASTRDFANQILKTEQGRLMDISQAGILSAKTHTPAIIERFLFMLLSVGALLSGYSMAVQKEEDGFLTLVYVVLMGFTLYVIFALEFPDQIQNPDFLNAELLRAQKLIQ